MKRKEADAYISPQTDVQRQQILEMVRTLTPAQKAEFIRWGVQEEIFPPEALALVPGGKKEAAL